MCLRLRGKLDKLKQKQAPTVPSTANSNTSQSTSSGQNETVSASQRAMPAFPQPLHGMPLLHLFNAAKASSLFAANSQPSGIPTSSSSATAGNARGERNQEPKKKKDPDTKKKSVTAGTGVVQPNQEGTMQTSASQHGRESKRSKRETH